MNALETLQQRFGFDSFREGQEKVINSLLDGKSAAAVFPTGAGKSLCYQLPAILLPGLTLVVSPLLALMKDQVDALLEKQIAAARLDSSLTSEEYAEVLSKARNGEIKLLYVAPERFNNERFRQAVKRFRISLMAIDEAHCVSEWGHNFRPEYASIGARLSYGARHVTRSAHRPFLAAAAAPSSPAAQHATVGRSGPSGGLAAVNPFWMNSHVFMRETSRFRRSVLARRSA